MVVLRCVRLVAVALGVTVALAGCAYVDRIDKRYDTVNRSAAQARDEAILLNIVRASEDAPLSFVAISGITTETTALFSAALPTFAVGPNPAPEDIERVAQLDNSTLSASSSVTNSVDLTVLESSEFNAALLSPVNLPTLRFLVRQGYSRALLFSLLTESVREHVAGHTFEYRNEPDAACEQVLGRQRCFRDIVDVAIASGLTVETRIGALGEGAGDLAEYGRLCFDPLLARRAQADYPPDVAAGLLARPNEHQPICGDRKWSFKSRDGGTDTLTFDLPRTRYGPVHYEIITRSTFAIYRFLGRILAEHAIETARIEARRNEKEDTRILAVTHESGSGCFVHTSYDGSSYCVPQMGAETTKRIFGLLDQLIALNTQPGDLAITPKVRVIR